MSIFSRKEKVNLAEFCSSYYDEFLLNPVLGGVNLSESYNESILDKIFEVDNTFRLVNQEEFNYQILLIRFELFALAWVHKFGIELGISNSSFTKEYLESISSINIWEDTLPYNHAVSDSATYGYDSSTALGRFKLYDITKTKVDEFRKYIDKGFDGKCIARVLNRYGTESKWDRMIITHNHLIFTLNDKLGHTFNEQSAFILIATLKGFYDGVTNSLKNLKIIS